MAIVGIILVSLFFIGDFHTLYWSHPAVYVTLTIAGPFSALCGGFLTGKNVPIVQVRKRASFLFPVELGRYFLVIGGLLWLIAIFLAIVYSQGGYKGDDFSHGYGSYYGDWLFFAFQVGALHPCIFLELIGSFIVGLHVQKKREDKISSLGN